MALKDSLDSILTSNAVTSNDTVPQDKLLAAAFVLINRDGIVYSNAAGRLDFPASAAPYTTSSISWIASMTKLLTATCLLQLVERSILSLDEDVRPRVHQLAEMRILRGFDASDSPILESNSKPITLRHLLTHTLGLGYDLADPDLMKWSASVNRTANNLDWSLEGFTTPLKFDPGDGWYYGAAYDWAGHLLTLVTGQSLSKYMAQHIFTPLGMESTTFWPRQVDSGGSRTLSFAFASQDPNEAGLLKPGEPPVPEQHEMESGGAGLYSTPDDYGKFLHGILSHKLLSPQTTDLLFSSQLRSAQADMLMAIANASHDALVPEFPRGTPLDHGLGGVINREDIQGKRKKGSMMWSGMSNGRWWIDRETGIAGVVFTEVLPHGNPVLTAMWNELESAVYDDFNNKESIARRSPMGARQ
jgi:CubicO group peptidase (beta-lactamase class C family)